MQKGLVMKLRKVRIKNFRGYKDVSIDISNLNVIIGKNDVGKSTIIDALDIYFNDAQIDITDLNVFLEEADKKYIEISCCFEVDPEETITLDASDNTATCLRDEFLLNADGLLEISKVYEVVGNKINKPVAKLIAKHPTNFATPLVTMKIKDLQKLADDLGITRSNNSIKKCIRAAIFEQTENLQFDDNFVIETGTKESDIIDIFNKFKDDLPIYMPFRADRTNTDKDKEVNDTTKAIAKTAVVDLESKFEEIKREIVEKIKDIADKTLEKLRVFDKNIANSLEPNIFSKNLDSLFSFTFSCDNGISFNKRGSGVKRLMLLSFFLADSERNNSGSRDVIYAIEEPETSQHPDYQIMLMNSFKQLAASMHRQIILTTHTPEIVKMVDKDNVIFLQKNDTSDISVQQNNSIDIKRVADTLGILPFVSYKGVIFVEGATDIRFLKNLNNMEPFKAIIDLKQFSLIPLHGGANIDSWIKMDYLRNSNVKCLYFKDRDDESIQEIVSRDNCIRTRKREIENYIPIKLVENRFNIRFTEQERANWDNIDVALAVSNKKDVVLQEATIKSILQSSDVWREISLLPEDVAEITDWFERIKYFFES